MLGSILPEGPMSPRPRPDPKAQALRRQGALNPHAERVRDDLFLENDFFDPRDRVQVKYEMVRRVEVEGWRVRQAAERFGFSRPSFYKAQSAFHEEGLAGLVPRRRGPRRAHKLTPEVMAFIEATLAEDPSLRARALGRRIEGRWGLRVHPRTLERALRDGQKKRL